MSDLSEHRRPLLCDYLPGPGRFGDYASLARLDGLEASLLRVVTLRRLHRDLPSEDRFASPSAAQPPQRGRPATGRRGAVRFSRVRFSDALPWIDQLAGPAEPPFDAA